MQYMKTIRKQFVEDYIEDKDIVAISDELYAELTYKGKHVSIANFHK